MDPHNDFDKHDRPPVFCRCGHERDDHDSRTEMRRGEKAYIQKCAHCACEVFVDVDGPLSRMIKDIGVYPTAIHYELDGPAGGARGCTQAYQRTPQSTGALLTCPDEIAIRVAQRVAELPDRTSPADWPDAMLVTSAELQFIVTDTINESVAAREEETRDSVLLAVKADRAAVADFILSCREGGNRTNVVQVFDVLASKIRNGEHLTVPETQATAEPSTGARR